MSNGIRTAGLLAAMIVVCGLVGPSSGRQQRMVMAFGFAIAMSFAGYWFSDKVVLRMSKATAVASVTAPELYEMVDRLRQRANLPMPKVYVIPSDQPNAFATGRNPAN